MEFQIHDFEPFIQPDGLFLTINGASFSDEGESRKFTLHQRFNEEKIMQLYRWYYYGNHIGYPIATEKEAIFFLGEDAVNQLKYRHLQINDIDVHRADIFAILKQINDGNFSVNIKASPYPCEVGLYKVECEEAEGYRIILRNTRNHTALYVENYADRIETYLKQLYLLRENACRGHDPLRQFLPYWD